MQKQFPGLLARVVLVLLLLFSIYQAAHAYVANTVSSLFYHLGALCIAGTLLAAPPGQLLPPRNATLANVYKDFRQGKLVRMTRVQTCLSLLGFVLFAVGAWTALTSSH